MTEVRLPALVTPVERLRVFLLAMFLFSIPWYTPFSSISIILLTAGLVVPNVIDVFKTQPRELLCHPVFYLYMAVPILLNLSEGRGTYLETISPFLVFAPLFAIHSRFIRTNATTLLLIYAVGISIAMIACLILGMYTYWNEFYIFVNGYDDVTVLIGMHSAYLSLFISCSFFAVLEITFFRFSSWPVSKRIAAIAWLSFLAFAVFYVRSRTGLVSFILVCLFVFVYQLRGKQRVLAIVGVAALLISIYAAVNLTSFNKGRFEIPQMLSHVREKQVQWRASWNVFKSHPLLGVGQPKASQLLTAEYEKLGFIEGIEFNYNSHNQYLTTLLQGGLIGFVLVFFPFAALAWRAVKFRQLSALCLCLLIMLAFVTESMLERHKGVIFFGFFVGFFLTISVPGFILGASADSVAEAKDK